VLVRNQSCKAIYLDKFADWSRLSTAKIWQSSPSGPIRETPVRATSAPTDQPSSLQGFSRIGIPRTCFKIFGIVLSGLGFHMARTCMRIRAWSECALSLLSAIRVYLNNDVGSGVEYLCIQARADIYVR